VSPLHDLHCTCGSTQPYVGKVAGYDMHKSKYQINEERYGTPGEYYDFVRWTFVDNRVQVHPDGPEHPLPTSRFKVGDTWRMRKPTTGGKGEFVIITEVGRKLASDIILVSFDRGADMPKDYRYETWPTAKFAEWYDYHEPPTGPCIYVQNLRGNQGHVVEFGRRGQDQVAALVQWYAPGAQPVWRSMDQLTIVHPDDVARCENGQTGDECGEGENRCELCLADVDAEADEIEESMGPR